MKKRNPTFTQIAQIIESNTRMPINEFLDCSITQSNIENIDKAIETIKSAINSNRPIIVYGDYDADGVTATAQFKRFVCGFMGYDNILFVIPSRYKDGYGLNAKTIETCDANSLIVTIDNGIAAIEAIDAAIAKGCEVVVIDHHLPKKEVPNATIIVDPHINENDVDLADFCASGLIYRLIKRWIELYYNSHEQGAYSLLCICLQLAAIGTVADVMPLIKDNRAIVRNGLTVLNKFLENNVLNFLCVLCDRCGLSSCIQSEDVAFKIAPIINAAGRMLEDGAYEIFETLSQDIFDSQKIIAKVEYFIGINEQRKTETKRAFDKAKESVIMSGQSDYNPIIVCDESVSLGIVGIVAGKLQEEFRHSAFVFTETSDEMLTGSARGYDESYNIAELIEASIEAGIVSKGGGHMKAAGLSLPKAKLNEFIEFSQSWVASNAKDIESNEDTYDLEISIADVPKVIKELDKFAPFGEGNRSIMFKVSDYELRPVDGKFYKTMGSDNNTVKLYNPNLSAIGFGLGRIFEFVSSKSITLYGTISRNYFGLASGEAIIQIAEFEENEIVKKQSELSKKLDAMLLAEFKC